MINLEHDDPSPAYVLGQLAGHMPVRTTLTVTDPDGFEHPLHLRGGDHACSGEDCDELITPEPFGEDAPFFLLLARQKLKYDETYCSRCL